MNALNYLKINAQRYPDRTVFSDHMESLTYEELLQKVSRIGNSLRNSSCFHSGSGLPMVGVIASRDIWSLVAFLGIAYSGAVYIPLDPKLPEQKLEKILMDSMPCMILGRSGEDRLLPAGCTVPFLDISDMLSSGNMPWQGLDSFLPFEDSSLEEHPLYMVYTSGSTGFPKGVLKSHEAVCSFIESYIRTFSFSEQEIIGNQTPFFFDASAKDLYLTLALGAVLEIIPEETFLLPPALIRYLNKKNITFISWVPSALALITQYNTFSEYLPTTLKKVFFVGEAFPVRQFQKWQEALPDLEYVNLYGASELAGVCCYYRVPPRWEGNSLPIGKPLENCRVFLADNSADAPANDPVIITESGRVGEILLESKALAMEYYHDPEKTATSFLDIRGHRVFRTGDLAWMDENGDLYFAARNDSQIKHMGQRIELGEIEAICQTLPVIEKACCLYNSEKKRIYLFCQLASGAKEDTKSLLLQLKQILPTYMLPQRVVFMEQLPLNANGKIDRQTLKAEMVS